MKTSTILIHTFKNLQSTAIDVKGTSSLALKAHTILKKSGAKKAPTRN